MPEYILPRTGDVPLVFEGERIARANSRRPNGSGENRWHALDLYRTRGGKYVLAISYCGQWQGENNTETAVIASNVAAVRDELKTYEVVPEGIGYPPGEAYADKQRRMTVDLSRRFKQAVSELFEELGDEFAERID